MDMQRTPPSPQGVSLAYHRQGDHGHPVVLIMGFGMPGVVWGPIADTLAQHHRVVWFDNRGIGQSDKPPGPYTMAQMADDTAHLLDHLGWDKAHIVGVSMGGMIAQEFALRHPQRLPTLSLIATHPGGLSAVVPPLKGLKLFLRTNTAKDPNARMANLEQLLYTQNYLNTTDRAALRARLIAQFQTPASPKGRLSQLAAVLRHNTIPRLPRLAGLPTLIIKPSEDKIVHVRNSRRMHRLIPDATLREIADSGHGLVRQHPERVCELLREHFTAVDDDVQPAQPAPTRDDHDAAVSAAAAP